MCGNNDTNKNNNRGKAKWNKNKKALRITSSKKTTSGCQELKDYIIDSSKPGYAGVYEDSMREIAKYIGRKYDHGGDMRKAIEKKKT